MRILIICPMLPWPIKAGGDQAVFNMINYLQHQCDIHFLYPSGNEDNAGIQLNWNKVTFHPFQKSKDFAFIKSRIALKVFNRFRLGEKGCNWLQSASNFFTPDFLDFVDLTIRKINPDIVQTEFYNFQDLVFSLPEYVKKVFIQHEIRYIINSQRLVGDVSTAKRFAFNKLKSEEIVAMNNYDAVITLTEHDKCELEKNGVISPIFCSAAGIEQVSERNPCVFNDKLIFVGGSEHTPNLEGVTWFIQNAWNYIKERHPEISFNIIGKWSESAIKSAAGNQKNINFKGFVADLQKEYLGAIAVVPILRGSGMRMKIIDAVNYGSPFVSTTIGAEGLEYRDGVDCFITDNPKDFSNKIIELIENENIRSDFYANSIITRDKYYTMRALADRRMACYNKILKS